MPLVATIAASDPPAPVRMRICPDSLKPLTTAASTRLAPDGHPRDDAGAEQADEQGDHRRWRGRLMTGL